MFQLSSLYCMAYRAYTASVLRESVSSSGLWDHRASEIGGCYVVNENVRLVPSALRFPTATYLP